MLRLLLLRHAKSAWDDAALSDFDRPLNARGRSAAPLVAAFLVSEGLVPDRVLLSSARRARETYALMLPIVGGEATIKMTRRLYDASGPALLEAIREGGATAGTLLVVGHNPAIEDVAHLLAADGDPAVLEAMHAKFPTAALAILTFQAARWADIGPGGGRLAAFVTPRALQGP